MSVSEFSLGDYVYYDCDKSHPYRIGKIEEFIKTSDNGIDVRVVRVLRKRDLHRQAALSVESKYHFLRTVNKNPDFAMFSDEQKEDLSLRELFISRFSEIISVDQIQNKCFVNILSDFECLSSYLQKEDNFFYSLVLDPNYKKLSVEKGEIRIGNRYQASIPLLKKRKINIKNDKRILETLLWTYKHRLSDELIDKFIVYVRTLGTAARALDCTPLDESNCLLLCAATASRDATISFAMDTLHRNNYIMRDALSALFNGNMPVVHEDGLENWTKHEGMLFEESLRRHGKHFGLIRGLCLPWKSIGQLVEYYYVWKTTDYYVRMKMNKPKKITRVSVTRDSSSQTSTMSHKSSLDRGVKKELKVCNACKTSYYTEETVVVWDSSNKDYNFCNKCWTYWKKYGGL